MPPFFFLIAPRTVTTPFRARHPHVRFSIVSCTSIEVLAQLTNLEIDAGLTYLDNEPLGRVTAIPLYRELQRMLGEIAAEFAVSGTNVYDLGCSDGITLATLSSANHAVAVQLARIPDLIRGYGHVKERNVKIAREEEARLLEAYRAPSPTPQVLVAA